MCIRDSNKLVDGPREVDQKDTLRLKFIERYHGKTSFTFETQASESSPSREFSTEYIDHGLYTTLYMAFTKEPGESLEALGLTPNMNPDKYILVA